MLRDDDTRARVYRDTAKRYPRRATALYRGEVRLAHQAQEVQRDLCGEEITANLGEQAMAFMLTDADVQERIDGRWPGAWRGTGLPYRFLVYSPRSCALSWTAFFSRRELDAWCVAYGVRLVSEPEPGKSFWLQLPETTDGFLPLEEREETET